nr:FeoB-associated Cys-rich membrane protein [Maliibacterium massiliense]
MNLIDIAVAMIVLGLVAGAIVGIVKRRAKGQGGCGCGCSGCPHAHDCRGQDVK